jgi:sulfide:quinone oxidoreductase
MNSTTPQDPFNVVIVGGGVAALEAALALRDLGGERFALTLVAPEPDFVYRPMAVREPFAYGAAQRYPVADLAAEVGARLLVERFASVEPSARVAHTEEGTALSYDALVLGLGARAQAYFEHAVTIDDARLDEVLHGLIEDVDGGYVRRVAFLVPPRMAWPLPIYELALMTARRAYEMNVQLEVIVATPELAPLAIFGDGASAGVSELLEQAGIETHTSAQCEVPDSRHVVLAGRAIEVDRVVALPELFGPAVRGLRAGDHGFIPIDEHCRVLGTEQIYAAGDATEFAPKYGGIAAQQADTAALAIAKAAGLPVTASPLRPVIHGILLTGAAPRYLSARLTGGAGFSSEITDEATWSPPVKIAALHLSRYLATRDQA